MNESIPSLTLEQYYILSGFKHVYYSTDKNKMFHAKLDQHARLKLANVYSDWLHETTPDIYCGECVDEMFNRLMEAMKRFERTQTKSL